MGSWRRVISVAAVAFCFVVPLAPAWGAPVLGQNILSNWSFESDAHGSPGQWQVSAGVWNRRSSDPTAADGTYYYSAQKSGNATIYQDVDLTAKGYDADRLATGGYYVSYGGYQRCWPESLPWTTDLGRISLNQYTSGGPSGGSANGSDNMDWRYSVGAWGRTANDHWRLNADTTELRYTFETLRTDLFDSWNDAWLDVAFVTVNEYAIWTWGDTSASHAGTGSWNAGSLTVGDTSDGGVHVTNGGTMTTDNLTLGLQSSAFGTLDLVGATLNVNGTAWAGPGTANIAGGGLWTSGNNVYVGTSNGFGTVNLDDGNWNAGGRVIVGGRGSGEMNISSEGQWTTDGEVYFGFYAGYGARGTANVDGGSWNAGDTVAVGASGAGEVNVFSGGQWTTDGEAIVGIKIWASTPAEGGTVNIDGGTWNAGYVRIGEGATGEVNISNDGQWTTDGSVLLGRISYGDVGHGVVNLKGGAWYANGNLAIGYVGTGTGEVNITGGTMYTAVAPIISDTGTLRLDGGQWRHTGDLPLPGGGRFRFLSGTLAVTDGTLTGLDATVSEGRHVQMIGSSALLQVERQSFGAGSSLTLDGATLEVTSGGSVTFSGPLHFAAGGGTVRLRNARLFYAAGTLALAGGEVVGSGELLIGAAGVDLGSTEQPGGLLGTSDTERLTVYGDVTGSGSLMNVTVFGDVSVGDSAGEMSLENVLFTSASTVAMGILGPEEDMRDRMVIGPGVDFAGCRIEIDFVAFTPDPADVFDLFDPAGEADLAATLAGAAVITPDNWWLDTATGVLTRDPELPTLGDANLDGVVNDDDLSLVLANWNQDVTGDPDSGWGRGEFSGVAPVNDSDLSLLLANWTGGSQVPEPTTLGLLSVGALVLAWRRGR